MASPHKLCQVSSVVAAATSYCSIPHPSPILKGLRAAPAGRQGPRTAVKLKIGFATCTLSPLSPLLRRRAPRSFAERARGWSRRASGARPAGHAALPPKSLGPVIRREALRGRNLGRCRTPTSPPKARQSVTRRPRRRGAHTPSPRGGEGMVEHTLCDTMCVLVGARFWAKDGLQSMRFETSAPRAATPMRGCAPVL